MADRRIPADVNDAVYRVVHDFGANKLASLTGTSAGVILNKANPHDSAHHKPTLADALVWSQLTRDMRIVHALCQTLGGVFVPLDGVAEQSDAALLDLICERDSALGEFARALRAALADGRVSSAEYAELHTELYQAVTALLTLLTRLEGMVRG